MFNNNLPKKKYKKQWTVFQGSYEVCGIRDQKGVIWDDNSRIKDHKPWD